MVAVSDARHCKFLPGSSSSSTGLKSPGRSVDTDCKDFGRCHCGVIAVANLVANGGETAKFSSTQGEHTGHRRLTTLGSDAVEYICTTADDVVPPWKVTLPFKPPVLAWATSAVESAFPGGISNERTGRRAQSFGQSSSPHSLRQPGLEGSTRLEPLAKVDAPRLANWDGPGVGTGGRCACGWMSLPLSSQGI